MIKLGRVTRRTTSTSVDDGQGRTTDSSHCIGLFAGDQPAFQCVVEATGQTCSALLNDSTAICSN